MANCNNTVLYTGFTSDLKERVTQHKSKKHPDSFSARYNISKLVYYEFYGSIGDAIKREKQIKGGSRKNKVDLINSMNPEWIDLGLILDGSLRLLLRQLADRNEDKVSLVSHPIALFENQK